MATNTQFDQILRVVEMFEKDAVARVKEYAKVPLASARAALANENVQVQLRKIGFASQAEVDQLSSKVEKLEAELARLKAPRPRAPKKSPTKTKTSTLS